jgi:membrane-bound ClpP family serine protease
MEPTLMQFIQGFTLPAVIFLVVGLALLVVEMFTPGFGLPGMGGIICLAVAVVIRANTLAEALWMIIILLAVVGLLLLIFLKSATKGAISRSPLVLKDAIDEQSGYISTADLKYFVGKTGKTLTTLRPSGMADFDGVRLDVVSNGEFIPVGCDVKITGVEGRKILVNRVEVQI